MTYQRKCKNWLETFRKWTEPRSEAPLTFIDWAGLFTIASVLRRNVKISKSLMGSYDIAPNLFVIFVGAAGGPRKTTTVDYSVELLARLPQIKRAADLTSKEDLVDNLLKSEGVAMTVIAGELGEFFAKSGPEMFGTLTNLYDAKRDLTVSTLTRGVQFGEKPCLNFIGATTPEWIGANVPESIIGGGFASRVIFVEESTVRRRQLYYRNVYNAEMVKLGEDLTDDLHHLAGISGDYEVGKEAEDFMEDWYQTMVKPTNTKLHGYFNRRHVHAHKVAMSVKASYSDDMELTIDDFKTAIEYLKSIEKNLGNVFLAVGRNKYVIDVKTMAAYVRQKQRVERKVMLEEFYSIAEPDTLDRLIKSLIDLELVKQDVEFDDPKTGQGQHFFYCWIGE